MIARMTSRNWARHTMKRSLGRFRLRERTAQRTDYKLKDGKSPQGWSSVRCEFQTLRLARRIITASALRRASDLHCELYPTKVKANNGTRNHLTYERKGVSGDCRYYGA